MDITFILHKIDFGSIILIHQEAKVLLIIVSYAFHAKPNLSKHSLIARGIVSHFWYVTEIAPSHLNQLSCLILPMFNLTM